MRRTANSYASATLTLTLLLTLVLASPAAAKVDLRTATVTGPGLDEPLVLKGQDAWSFLLGGATPEAPAAAVTPRGDLGPRFDVRVEAHSSSVETWSLALHPFAEDGPVLWFGHGQLQRMVLEWSERASHTGWIEVSDRQLEMLRARDFPAAAGAAAAAAAGAAEPAGDRGVEPTADVAAGTRETASSTAGGEGAPLRLLALGTFAAAAVTVGARAAVRRRAGRTKAS